MSENISENPSNPENTDLDNETMTKLKGDAIGDTLYSEVFVLKTLLKLSSTLKWDKDFENDLCFLWDMTQEEEVCDYLLKASFPAIAAGIVQKCPKNNRLIEIVIGIVANILCPPDSPGLEQEEVRAILEALDSNDTLILIQIMRLLHALSLKDLSFLNEELWTKIIFILQNSLNRELLLNCLKYVAAVTDFKINNLGEILKGAIVAAEVLTNNNSEDNQIKLAVRYLVEITCNICGYSNKGDSRNIFKNSEEKDNVLSQFLEFVVKYFEFNKNDDNFLPLSEEFVFEIEALTYIFQTLNLKFCSEIFAHYTEILIIIFSKNCLENNDKLIEFFLYFVSVGDIVEIRNILTTKFKAENLLNYINNKEINVDFDYKEKLGKILL